MCIDEYNTSYLIALHHETTKHVSFSSSFYLCRSFVLSFFLQFLSPVRSFRSIPSEFIFPMFNAPWAAMSEWFDRSNARCCQISNENERSMPLRFVLLYLHSMFMHHAGGRTLALHITHTYTTYGAFLYKQTHERLWLKEPWKEERNMNIVLYTTAHRNVLVQKCLDFVSVRSVGPKPSSLMSLPLIITIVWMHFFFFFFILFEFSVDILMFIMAARVIRNFEWTRMRNQKREEENRREFHHMRTLVEWKQWVSGLVIDRFINRLDSVYAMYARFAFVFIFCPIDKRRALSAVVLHSLQSAFTSTCRTKTFRMKSNHCKHKTQHLYGIEKKITSQWQLDTQQ